MLIEMIKNFRPEDWKFRYVSGKYETMGLLTRMSYADISLVASGAWGMDTIPRSSTTTTT